MKFSVLMSVYKNDRCEEVKEAINSILEQSLKPNQIVLVIDGPIFDSLKYLIDEFAKDKLFTIVSLEKNVGLGSALAIGIMHCKYEYVARMDADDISRPERFLKQISFLLEHPEVDVLGGKIAEFDYNMEKIIGIRNVPIEKKEISSGMKYRNSMNHVTVIFKKSKVLEAGNYQTCMYFEDYYLWCRMLKNNAYFYNLNEILVNVRSGDLMYGRRGGKKYNRAVLTFQNKILKIGIINRTQYILNLFVRLIVANLPNNLRGIIYHFMLREKYCCEYNETG